MGESIHAALAQMMQTGKLTAPELITSWVAFDDATDIFQRIARAPEAAVKFGVKFE